MQDSSACIRSYLSMTKTYLKTNYFTGFMVHGTLIQKLYIRVIKKVPELYTASGFWCAMIA